MADNVDVNNSPEAAYVRTLQWTEDGLRFVCKNIPDNVKEKLKAIFYIWKIGFYADRMDCKGSNVNVSVFKSQFERVQFSLENDGAPTKESE
jgi:hypothetical protein